jgi:peptide/nickel transport system substrate-binding protein
VRYDFTRQLANYLFSTAHQILPLHKIAKLNPADVRSWPLNDHPLASGPFRLESWERNRELVLVRNEHYPGPPPYLDRLVFRIIPDETARVIALETGEADFMDDLPVAAAGRLSRSGEVSIHRVSGREYGYLMWNFRNPIFADPRTRKAISLAIDRSRFIDDLMGGFASPASSPLPPALWAHNPGIPADPYDPHQARQLLAAAGWEDQDGDGVLELAGQEFVFEILTRQGDPVRENGVVVIRENLRQIGILARPRILEHATSLAMVRKGDFDAYLGLWQASMMVDPSSQLHSESVDRCNYGHYCNAQVDSLIDLGLSLVEREEAKVVWDRLQQIVVADLPMAFLYYPEALHGVNKRLRNVRPHILSPFNNITEWWIAPADRKYAVPAP